MSSPILEPYRDEIFSMLRKGQSKADVWRTIEREHGVKISRSQFYAFAEQLGKDTRTDNEEERVMTPREASVSQSTPEEEAVRAFLTDLPRAIEEFTARLTTLEQQSREHEQKTLAGLRQCREELAGYARRMETLPARPETLASPETEAAPETILEYEPTVPADRLRSIWKRAFIVSGIFWLLVELLVMRGYWYPLWEILSKWIGFAEIIRL